MHLLLEKLLKQNLSVGRGNMVTLALIIIPAKTLLAITGFAVRVIYHDKQFPINTQQYKT
jgi:hypothetical protein